MLCVDALPWVDAALWADVGPGGDENAITWIASSSQGAPSGW